MVAQAFPCVPALLYPSLCCPIPSVIHSCAINYVFFAWHFNSALWTTLDYMWQAELAQQFISTSLLTCRFLWGKQDTGRVRVKYLDCGLSESTSGRDCLFSTCLGELHPPHSYKDLVQSLNK